MFTPETIKALKQESLEKKIPAIAIVQSYIHNNLVRALDSDLVSVDISTDKTEWTMDDIEVIEGSLEDDAISDEREHFEQVLRIAKEIAYELKPDTRIKAVEFVKALRSACKKLKFYNVEIENEIMGIFAGEATYAAMDLISPDHDEQFTSEHEEDEATDVAEGIINHVHSVMIKIFRKIP